MLIAITTSGTIMWSGGDPLPDIDMDSVVSLTAVEKDLDAIRARLTGIPDYPNSRAMLWYGDIAKTILHIILLIPPDKFRLA